MDEMLHKTITFNAELVLHGKVEKVLRFSDLV